MILRTTEIFMYFEENLKLTPESLSDKAVAMDELKEMYQQVYNPNNFNILLNQSLEFIGLQWFSLLAVKEMFFVWYERISK